MSYIYPNKCKFCGRVVSKGKIICEECVKNSYPIGDSTCYTCGKDIENCVCKIGDFAFLRNVSYFYYKGSIQTIVKRFKFRDCPQLAPFMAKYMLSKIRDKYKDFTFDFITFVPSMNITTFFRGYNPAELLAKHIADAMNLSMCGVLRAKFRFVSQKYSKSQRRKNAKGKFYTEKTDLTGKSILLIDDIMTSGATLSECALALKRAGAKEVLCATFAITLKK